MPQAGLPVATSLPSRLEAPLTAGETTGEPLVGRRRLLPALKGHGGTSWRRWRYPFTRRTPLLFETVYNPVTLAAERRILDRRPGVWLLALIVLAVAPPLFGNNSFVAAATTFAMYAAINVIWMLTIGTAGI